MRHSLPTRFSFPLAAVVLMSACSGLAYADQPSPEPCRIEVVDQQNGWPVPLVELSTTNHLKWVTDNAGVVAIDAPDLFGREVWFHIHSHGYQVKADGFGMRGKRIEVKPGETVRIEIERINIAKRLGRLTGVGLYAESQKTGRDLDWTDGPIFGCDSVQNAVHNGRLYWLWGDTTMANYPLGEFHGTSATTDIRPLTSFEPPLKLALDYFVNDQGRARGIAPMKGAGPTWVSGYVSLRDAQGTSHLVGTYTKIRPPMTAYERGLCVWDDATETFRHFRTLWREKDPEIPYPDGHPAFWTDKSGKEWVVFGNPFPTIKIPATFEGWKDQSTWVKLEPQDKVMTAGGEEIDPHTGHIIWNEYRQRWVAIFMQAFAKESNFGELWYAEADQPTGPWGPAVKVVTHDNYTFYNPRIHPEFTADGSPILIFEGTYTEQFTNKAVATPRYDYNQILYRLDLDDPQLAPAQQPLSIE